MANVALVVGNSGSLDSDDSALQTRLGTTLSHTVTVVDDGVATPAGLASYALIVFAGSAGGWALGSSFTNTAIPILSLAEDSFYNLRLCDGAATHSGTQITFQGSTLTGGNSGLTTVYSGTGNLGYAYNPASGFAGSAGVKAAVALSNPAQDNHIIGFPAGAALRTGTAPAGRVAFFGTEAAKLTSAAWDAFDAAVDYLIPSADVGISAPTGAVTVDFPSTALTSVPTVPVPTVELAVLSDTPTPALGYSAAAPVAETVLSFNTPLVSTDSQIYVVAPTAELDVTLTDPTIATETNITPPTCDLVLSLDAPTAFPNLAISPATVDLEVSFGLAQASATGALTAGTVELSVLFAGVAVGVPDPDSLDLLLMDGSNLLFITGENVQLVGTIATISPLTSVPSTSVIYTAYIHEGDYDLPQPPLTIRILNPERRSIVHAR